MAFNFTNEQIVYLYKHIDNYIDVIKNTVLKDLRYAQGQLELSEKIYGKDKSFNREEHDLQMRLIRDELPKTIKERTQFLASIRDQLESPYESIIDAEPELLTLVEEKYFNDSEAMRVITDQLNQKGDNDGYED